MPSFSAKTKQELTRVRLRAAAARRAQLIGLTHAAGALRLGHSFGLEYLTETREVAEHIAMLAKSLYKVEAVIALRDQERRQLVETVLTGEGVEQLLTDAGLFSRTSEGVELTSDIPSSVFDADESRRAFLRGAFMGAGSVNAPINSYHLEIVCRGDEFAQEICAQLLFFSCPAKTVRRKRRTVVYLKEGDLIAMVLALLGASNAVLSFEDTRASKELRNYINRASNCDTANISKTVDAASEQIEGIKRILADPLTAKRLSPVLRETAEIRLNNPEMNLAELAEICSIGKSGLNHRLQRLLNIAREMH